MGYGPFCIFSNIFCIFGLVFVVLDTFDNCRVTLRKKFFFLLGNNP